MAGLEVVEVGRGVDVAAGRPGDGDLQVGHLEVGVIGPAGRDVDTPADLDDLQTPT